MKTKTALNTCIVLAGIGSAQAAMIATDFAWVSTTTVTTDSTSLADSPTNTEFTVSTGGMNFVRSGTAAAINTGGPLTGTITLSFDKEISDLTLTVSDFRRDFRDCSGVVGRLQHCAQERQRHFGLEWRHPGRPDHQQFLRNTHMDIPSRRHNLDLFYPQPA